MRHTVAVVDSNQRRPPCLPGRPGGPGQAQAPGPRSRRLASRPAGSEAALGAKAAPRAFLFLGGGPREGWVGTSRRASTPPVASASWPRARAWPSAAWWTPPWRCAGSSTTAALPATGPGILMDIPWALLLDRFPEHARAPRQPRRRPRARSSCPSRRRSARPLRREGGGAGRARRGRRAGLGRRAPERRGPAPGLGRAAHRPRGPPRAVSPARRASPRTAGWPAATCCASPSTRASPTPWATSSPW